MPTNIFDMLDTWTNVGVTYNAIRMNVNNAGSASGSRLMDLLTNGISKFAVDPVNGVNVGDVSGGMMGPGSVNASGFFINGVNWLFSPTFLGDPKAPTPPLNDADTSIATTAYVQGNLASYLKIADAGGSFQPLDPDLVSIAAITAVNSLVYRLSADTWAPVTIGANITFVGGVLSASGGGVGGGAPTTAEYIMASGDATLTAERVLTNTATVTWDFTTPGQAKANASGVGGQPLDGDLTSLSNASAIGVMYYRSAAETWAPVTVSTGLNFAGGILTSTATGSVQISGTPTVGQTAKWTNATTIKGGNVYTASTTAPVTPDVGDYWYDLTTGILAISINDGNSQQWIQVAPNAANIASASSFVNVRVITSSTSYVPTPGTQFIQVECIGGGGGGGGSYGGVYNAGGGGGSGGYSRSILTAAQIGASQSISIGAAGLGGAATLGQAGSATSFGGLVSALGGIGGHQSSTDGVDYGSGGSGAPVGLGDIAFAGAPGGTGFFNQVNGQILAVGGQGGSSAFGGGGIPHQQILTPGQIGHATNYGSGGGGALCNAGTNGIGGNGSPGVVIITEYNIGVGQQGPQGLAGGVTTPLTPQGRLTLTAGTPVMAATVTGATTIRYAPYVGNQIPIWNGTTWATMSFNELLNVTTASSAGNAGPAAVAATSNYDLFVWSNAGVPTLTRGPFWTNATTRSAGTALVRQNGIWLNNAAITNGPAASRGTYVGTVRSNGSSQIDWIYGSAAALGGMATLNVWNCYNRTKVNTVVGDSTSSWTLSAGTTVPTNGSNTWRINFIRGLDEEPPVFSYTQLGLNLSAGAYVIGLGADKNNAYDVNAYCAPGSGGGYGSPCATLAFIGSIGAHFVQALQSGDNATTTTMYGSSGVNAYLVGLLSM